ncbi:MAG: hypothetical protein J2P23_03465 [Microlunatus sp.]|nr:hypothetical protein [Microlunatus sp.]
MRTDHSLLRVAALLISLVVSLVGLVLAPAVAAPGNYTLSATYPGDDLHIPVLMYRFRHSEPASASLPGAPQVSYDRNVAAFNFTRNGVEMVAVGPSISPYANQTRIALIDLYRKNPKTGDWELVDESGKPLTEGGVPVAWNRSRTASVAWDLSKETDPELIDELKTGIHSERVVSFYLKLRLNGADATTTRGLSERIPCTSAGNMCRINLAKGTWFPNLADMRYIIDLPNTVKGVQAASAAPTAQSTANGKVPKVALRYHTAPAHLEDIEDSWIDDGMPTNHDAVVYGLGYRAFVTPDSEPATGAAASALAPGSNPGGIDFSTLQLRYLSVAPGGKLRYAFTVAGAKPSVHNVGQGRTAAVQASDAFFVWLSMPKSSFWVNLNPNQPNRIVDAKLGTTDVGRILLQADFAMKKLVGKLIYPTSPLGRKYWGKSRPGSCLDTRQWIVPAPATVYEHDGGISIIKAPLDVKMESQYIKSRTKANSCVHPDARMEKAFRTLVLPKVVNAVNHGPQFAELRRVYLSRVAAEWYRTKHGQDGALRGLIDSRNVSAWPALKSWSPRTVFNQYVYSFRHKEFRVKEKTTKGNRIYTHVYTYGGVDFSRVQLQEASNAVVEHDHPGLSRTVQESLQRETRDQHGTIWLGAVSQPHMPKAAGPASARQPVFPAADLALVLICGLLALGCVVGLILATTLARGNRRGLLVTGMAVLLLASLVTGWVALERGVDGAMRNANGPTVVATPNPTRSPVPTGGPPATPVATRTPSHRASAPARPKPKPKPKHHPPRWTRPKRGHRPASPIFALTWRHRDKAELQRLDPLTFSFAIPRGYRCDAVPGVSFAVCGRGLSKKDPYVAIYPDTCGCTTEQVRKNVNGILHSKKAFGRMFPVDPYTRASDNGNGRAKHQYWMVRVYRTRSSHRLDHEIFVYAQANKRSDDVKIRKIIGDIYDATR